MPKTRIRKSDDIKKIQEQIAASKIVVFTNHQGLTVKDSSQLRRELRQGGVEFTVIKRTLLKKALAGSKFENLDLDQFAGGLGLATGQSDEVTPAKLLAAFSKTHPELVMLGAALDGRTLSQAEVVALSKLPTQIELRQQVVWMISSPLRGLVGMLSGPTRGLVTALAALRDQRSGQAST